MTFSALIGLIFSPRIGMKLAKTLVNSSMVLSFVMYFFIVSFTD